MNIVASKYRGKKIYLKIYNELITAARYRGTLAYKQMAKMMGLPSSGSYMGSQLGTILGEISEDEINNGRPMLSAIVVGVSGEPGKGFYGLAMEFGKLLEDSKEAREKFWESEKAAVYETWKFDLGED